MSDFVHPLLSKLTLGASGAGDNVLKNVGESDFVSPFWSWYIVAIVAIGFIFCIVILITQLRARTNKPGETNVQPHEWDENLQEYNNPLPRWWVWMFVLTMAFGATYLYLFPGLGDYKGSIGKFFPEYSGGWSEQKQYELEKAKLDATTDPMYTEFASMDFVALANDQKAMKTGERLFLNNCAQCHGSDARGSKGYPNLTDGDWLFGGFPDAIIQTITTGRHSIMTPQGDALGGPAGVNDMANYVLSLSGSPHDALAAARAKDKFALCAACHTISGKGSLADETGLLFTTGAPNLTDKVWLFGGDMKSLTDQITNGQDKNIMPSWDCLLGQNRIRVLAAYVWQLNRDDNDQVLNPTAPPEYLVQPMATAKAATAQARADAKAKGESECLAVSVVK